MSKNANKRYTFQMRVDADTHNAMEFLKSRNYSVTFRIKQYLQELATGLQDAEQQEALHAKYVQSHSLVQNQ